MIDRAPNRYTSAVIASMSFFVRERQLASGSVNMESIRPTKSSTFCSAVSVSGIELLNPAINSSNASKRPWSVGIPETTSLRLQEVQRMHNHYNTIETNLCCQSSRLSCPILCPTFPKSVSGNVSAAGDLRVFSKRSGSFDLNAAAITRSKATK